MQSEENLEEQKSEESLKETDDNQVTEGPEAKESKVEEVEEKEPKDLLQDEKDRYMRLYSEFDNYKRRTAKERLEFASLANKGMMEALLPIIDDFDRAMAATTENLTDEGKKIMEGMELIHKKMVAMLTSKGLKPMEAQGKDFDVEFHEAITKIKADKKMKGKVVDVTEKGYLLNETILRYAKVVVGE
jgi:molecular chaperone GrpE